MDDIKPPAQHNKLNKTLRKILGALLLLIILAEAVFLLSQNLGVRIAWASIVYDRREHYLDCEHLPFYGQVQKAAAMHQDVISSVKGISGVSGFQAESISCKIYDGGTEFIKGDFVLTYKTRAARQQAEKLIGPNFFSMPYRGYQN